MRPVIALSTAAMLGLGGIGLATTPAAAAGNGHALAVAEAKALLAEAPTLASATTSATAPAKILKHAPEDPGYTHLVQRAEYWTVDESWTKAYRALTATTPAGLTGEGSGRAGGPKPSDDLVYTVDGAITLPSGLDYAELIIAVTPTGHDTSAIGVYAQAVPQPPRPATENVSTSLHRAHVAQRDQAGHLVRGHTVTGSAAAKLIKDFNALRVNPPGGVLICPADFGVKEIVTFRSDGHTIVATTAVCGLVDVTRDGHRLPTLQMTTRYIDDIYADLGPAPRHKRPATEHVPLSVHRVHLVRRVEPGGSVVASRTVSGKRATQLVRAFDTMKTEPTDYLRCDIAGGPEDIVTFRTAKHRWVVKESACTNVVVTRDGTALPTLIANDAWDKALSKDL